MRNKKWENTLKTEPIKIEEVLTNWEEIFSEIDSLRAKKNFNLWKMRVHNIADAPSVANYVFSDFVDVGLNPWADWESMPDSLRLLVSLRDLEHAFKRT
jgi:hypothetical protein